MSFHVGQKVVCVNNTAYKNRRWNGEIPQLEETYTVSGIVTVVDPLGQTITALVLTEIKNTPEWFFAYAAHRFRPVIERSTETGMAILRKVADDASKRRNLVVSLHD